MKCLRLQQGPRQMSGVALDASPDVPAHRHTSPTASGAVLEVAARSVRVQPTGAEAAACFAAPAFKSLFWPSAATSEHKRRLHDRTFTPTTHLKLQCDRARHGLSAKYRFYG
jgi:hypothetical protein